MGYNIEIKRNAELDTESAIDYYCTISIDLAIRFKDELYATYEKIKTNPDFYKYLSKKRNKSYRCFRLKSFPYLVIYRINDNDIIVIAVFNTHRKPKYK